jgi:hypothetical protein
MSGDLETRQTSYTVGLFNDIFSPFCYLEGYYLYLLSSLRITQDFTIMARMVLSVYGARSCAQLAPTPARLIRQINRFLHFSRSVPSRGPESLREDCRGGGHREGPTCGHPAAGYLRPIRPSPRMTYVSLCQGINPFLMLSDAV